MKSVDALQAEVRTDVRLISRLNVLQKAIRDLGAAADSADPGPLADAEGPSQAAHSRYRDRMAELRSDVIGIHSIEAWLDRVDRSIEGRHGAHGRRAEMDEAIEEVNGAVEAIRGDLSVISSDLATKWTQLNTLVFIACALAAFTGILSVLHGRDVAKRKQAEETWRSSEERLNLLVSAVTDVIYRYDPSSGRYDFISPSFESQTGYAVDEIMTDPNGVTRRITHPDDVTRAFSHGSECIARGPTTGPCLLEYRVIRKDGRMIWVEDRKDIEWTPDGKVYRINGVVRDISERRRADEALHRHEAMLTKAQAIAHLGSWELDLERNRLSWSDEVFRIFGLMPKEFGATYEAFLNAVHPDDREAVNQAFTESLEGRAAYDITHRVLRPDGQVRVVHERCDHTRDEAGKVICSVGTVLDISERRRAEDALQKAHDELEARVKKRTTALSQLTESLRREIAERQRVEESLRRSERDYRTLFESAHDAIFVFDPNDETILEVNQRACDIYGFEREELLGNSLDLFQSEDRRGREKTNEILKHEGAGGFKLVHHRKDGTEVFVEANAAVVTYRGREAVISINRDVTGRLRAERESREHLSQLAHVSRLSTMGELAAGLAHELNQPLAAMANYSSACARMLESGSTDSRKLAEGMNKATAQAQLAGQIVRRLRSHVRKSEPKHVRVHLNALIRETLPLLEDEARKQGIAQRLVLADTLPSVYADSIQLKQVILNLLRNGIEAIGDAAPRRREIEIRTACLPDGAVEVSVSDTGPGLRPGAKDRAFEAFFTTKPQGIGIGLSISRSIIEAHRGTLSFVTNPGMGATARFTLPAACDSAFDV